MGIGKVYNNLMVDVKLQPMKKVVERSKRIIMETTWLCSYEVAELKICRSRRNVEFAIVMIFN